ncbi:uncharacterized protein [Panulirus ornatus]|uniref:uncharacterized protein n=1 Tax=Panulirus ornatus TaxID=150431 RepID=UPI003A83A5C5
MAGLQLFFVLLATLTQVFGQGYERHYAPIYKEVSPVTRTLTETVTHTLRETTTTDVWITDHTIKECVVTDYTTAWSYLPEEGDTRYSVITITSTPVVIVTATTNYNPVKTFVSIFTEFSTTTETIDLVQSLTHIDVVHQIHTVPVVTTQELVQQITSTTTYITTTTITSNYY